MKKLLTDCAGCRQGARMLLMRATMLPRGSRRESRDQSIPNASRTLPGLSPNVPYPQLTYTIPAATVGAGPYIDPPRARTPFTVVNARFAANVHTMVPSVVVYARTAPSFDGEKTIPG